MRRGSGSHGACASGGGPGNHMGPAYPAGTVVDYRQQWGGRP